MATLLYEKMIAAWNRSDRDPRLYHRFAHQVEFVGGQEAVDLVGSIVPPIHSSSNGNSLCFDLIEPSIPGKIVQLVRSVMGRHFGGDCIVNGIVNHKQIPKTCIPFYPIEVADELEPLDFMVFVKSRPDPIQYALEWINTNYPSHEWVGQQSSDSFSEIFGMVCNHFDALGLKKLPRDMASRLIWNFGWTFHGSRIFGSLLVHRSFDELVMLCDEAFGEYDFEREWTRESAKLQLYKTASAAIKSQLVTDVGFMTTISGVIASLVV